MSNPNRLIKEKSPYLLQHAANPVDWYAWSLEAFEKAKKENKPVFLSIGYSTCHWCHVMERESFEDDHIADILNEHFVCIKVDREERPDIDHIYMSFVTAMTGSGGWPLSVFLTPDKKPFFGGTYFPPEAKWGSPSFEQVLLSVSGNWRSQPEKILQSSEEMMQALLLREEARDNNASSIDEKIFSVAYRQLSAMFDPVFGGFGQSPKFPMGHNLSFLLRFWKKTKQPEILKIVEKTLKEISKGGICDHLGGGFHRYSTDRQWQVPHFEKMLYDQAILAKAYLETYQATKNSDYAIVAREIFDYVLRDMQYSQGGFFCAEDADSVAPEQASLLQQGDRHPEKKEGAYYLWGFNEIEDALGVRDSEIFYYHYNFRLEGNADHDPHGEFIGKNILYVAKTVEATAQHFKKSMEEIEEVLKRSKEKLLFLRTKRPRPHLDDKILTDWNGLMISALSFGAIVLNEPKYQKGAEDAAQFILSRLVREDGTLWHRFRDGEAAIAGHLTDYAFFINGLLDLYETTFKTAYLKEAVKFAETMMCLFWDEKNGGFFLSAADAKDIILRSKEVYDGALPSGNSVAALVFVRLARFFPDSHWEKNAQQVFSAFSDEISHQPAGYAQMLTALDFALGPSCEIVVVAENRSEQTRQILREVYACFIPNKIIILRVLNEKEEQELIELVPFIKEQGLVSGQPTIYVCRNHACQRPVTSPESLKALLDVEI
ncbi:MAG: thioredoxin domain-containing protein [Candidatus Omnitrophota bacterium]